jgi:phosphatidylglycerol:prolipoprotein diacylglycerol transferase
MYPELIEIPLPWGGSLTIASYGFMIMCGFLLALYLAVRRARYHGVSPEALFDSAIVLLLGGVIGARLFFVVQFWDELQFAQNPVEIIRIDKGGLVFYGGLIGGAIALLIMMWRKRMPLRATLGVAASVIPLGHAFGRMGCFLNGCCYGQTTESAVGLCFPRVLEPGNVQNELCNVGSKHIVGSLPFLDHLRRVPPLVSRADHWSHPVHATQLYAVGYNLVIFAVLSFWLSHRHRAGEVAWIYCVLYGMARFGNEILRATEPVMMGMSIAQWICIPLVIFGLVMLVWERSKPGEPLPEPVPVGEGTGENAR